MIIVKRGDIYTIGKEVIRDDTRKKAEQATTETKEKADFVCSRNNRIIASAGSVVCMGNF